MGKHKLLSLDTHKYKTTFTSTTKMWYCSWHGDGASALGLAAGWPTALLGGHLLNDVILSEISWR